jgi:rhodanese-related sulfurtransferase
MLKTITIVLFSTVAFAQQGQPPNGGTATLSPVQQESSSKARKLTRAEFDALLSHPDKILLIDVRRPDEISSIGGFPVYLSIQIDDLTNHLNAIPRDRTIITISNHAVRAGVAADLLIANGFRVAGAVGAQTYETDGGILVKIVPPKPEADSNPVPQQR